MSKRISSARFSELNDLNSYAQRLSPIDLAWLDRYKAQHLFQRVEGLSQTEKRSIWRRHAQARRDLYGFVGEHDPRVHETDSRAFEIASVDNPESQAIRNATSLAAEKIARCFKWGA